MPDSLFRRLNALSEPLRARTLHVLGEEELSVGELVQVLQAPQSTVSRHVKQLLNDGWLERRSAGTASFLRLADPLPDGAAPLWRAVQTQLQGHAPYSEDLRRMASVLTQRELDSRAFFGRNAERWALVRQELFGSGYLLPTFAALLPPDSRVADLGCGTGEVVAALAPSVARVVGVDREQAMLHAAARRTQGMKNVQLVEGGLEALPLQDNSLDAALCMLVLHHVQSPALAFSEIRRVLSPGGRFVVLDMVEHTRKEYRRSMGHQHLGFSETDLDELARRAGMRLLSYSRLPPEPGVLGPGLFLACIES